MHLNIAVLLNFHADMLDLLCGELSKMYQLSDIQTFVETELNITANTVDSFTELLDKRSSGWSYNWILGLCIMWYISKTLEYNFKADK